MTRRERAVSRSTSPLVGTGVAPRCRRSGRASGVGRRRRGRDGRRRDRGHRGRDGRRRGADRPRPGCSRATPRRRCRRSCWSCPWCRASARSGPGTGTRSRPRWLAGSSCCASGSRSRGSRSAAGSATTPTRPRCGSASGFGVRHAPPPLGVSVEPKYGAAADHGRRRDRHRAALLLGLRDADHGERERDGQPGRPVPPTRAENRSHLPPPAARTRAPHMVVATCAPENRPLVQVDA